MPEMFTLADITKCQCCGNRAKNLVTPEGEDRCFKFCARCARDFDAGIEQRTNRMINRSAAKRGGFTFTPEDKAIILAHEKVQ